MVTKELARPNTAQSKVLALAEQIDPEWLPVSEAVQRYPIARPTIYRLVRAGAVAWIKPEVGREIQVSHLDVCAWLLMVGRAPHSIAESPTSP